MARRAGKTARPAPKTSRVAQAALAPHADHVGAIALALAAFAGSVGIWLLRGSEAVTFDDAVVFAAVAGLVAGIILLLQPRFRIALSRLTYAWTAFLAWALVSAAVSGRFWAAFVGETSSMLGWSILAAMTAVALAAGCVALPLRRIIIAYGWYVLLAQAALVFWQLATHAVAGGTMPNSTYLGEVVLVLLPWTLATDGVPEWQRWPRRFTVVLTLAALAGSGSRVAAVVGGAWVVWTIARERTMTVRVRAAEIALLLAIILGAGLIFARAETEGSIGIATLGQRPAMARISAAALALRPLLGWGPDGYLAGGSAASTPGLAATGPMVVVAQGAGDPHDLLLWISVSTGVVGLALFGWFGAETVLAWRARLKRGVDAWPAIWAIGSVVAVLLTAPAFPAALPPLALVFGLSLWRGESPSEQPDVTHSSRALGLVVAVVLMLACAVLALDAGTRSRYEDVGPTSSPQVAEGSLAAARLWRFDPHLWGLAGSHVQEALSVNAAAFSRGSDVDAFQHAQALDSRNPVYPLQLAWTLEAYGAPVPQVEDAFQRALDLYPLHPQARANYATYLAGLGETAAAEQQLEFARIMLAKDPADTAPLQGAMAQAEAAIAAAAGR